MFLKSIEKKILGIGIRYRYKISVSKNKNAEYSAL